MTERFADLHLHTTFSDGTDTPRQLVELVHQTGISTMAITDHDNTDAIAIAEPIAKQLGVELIRGIEMSASIEDIEVHLLGFLMDISYAGLQAHLATQQQRRVQRVHQMIKQLQQVGVNISAEEVLQLAGEGTVGRPHVARTLLKHGYVSATAEAFTKYLSPGKPGFVSGSQHTPEYIIKVIREAGGVPVLAHPVYLRKDALIEQFVSQGLAGLEVYHSGHPPDLVQHYERIADRLRLLKTGGSDYHGNAKEGAPVGSVKVSYQLVEGLRAWKASHASR